MPVSVCIGVVCRAFVSEDLRIMRVAAGSFLELVSISLSTIDAFEPTDSKA